MVGPKIMPNLMSNRHECRLILQARPARTHEIRRARRTNISQSNRPRGRIAISEQMPKGIPPGADQPCPPPSKICDSGLVVTTIRGGSRNRTTPLIPIPPIQLRRVQRLLIPAFPPWGGLNKGLGDRDKNITHIDIEEIDNIQLRLDVVVHPTNSSSSIFSSGAKASQPPGEPGVGCYPHCCSIRRGRAAFHKPVGR